MTRTQSDGANRPIDNRPDALRRCRIGLGCWRDGQSVLLLALTLVAFVLVLAALMMPQMPHPIYADPAAAARWLLNTGSQFGSAGELWSALGLFNLQHSTLLRLLLILIALMLAVQLADQIGSALTLRRVASRLNDPAREPASPITLPKGGPDLPGTVGISRGHRGVVKRGRGAFGRSIWRNAAYVSRCHRFCCHGWQRQNPSDRMKAMRKIVSWPCAPSCLPICARCCPWDCWSACWPSGSTSHLAGRSFHRSWRPRRAFNTRPAISIFATRPRLRTAPASRFPSSR